MVSSTKKYKISDDHEEKFEHVKDRYITAHQTSGHLKIDEDGNIVDTKKSEKQSLMSQLKKRPTVLGDR
jgi:hypothetical protein